MKMKNTSSNTLKLRPDLFANWSTSGKRPEFVEVLPGAIFDVPDGYAVRRRNFAGSVPTVVVSTAEQLSVGALKPYGADAEELYAKFYVDTLPANVLEYARLATSSTSTNPDEQKAAQEAHDFGKRMLVVMGEQQAEAAPKAQPAFTFEES